MDALGIEQAIVAGFDWGARTANIVAALWPERCKALVVRQRLSDRQPGRPASRRCRRRPSSSGGISTTSPPNAAAPATTGTGATSPSSSGSIASPQWDFDDATFDRSAASFDNPDHVDIVIHNYRWRLGLAEGEPEYDELEKRLAEGPVITVPTITLEGDANGAPHPEPAAYANEILRQVRAPDDRRAASGTTCRKKRPQAFAQAVIDVDPH